jgi:hypothetical protein
VIKGARSVAGLLRFAALNPARILSLRHPFSCLWYAQAVRDPDLMSDLHRVLLWDLTLVGCERGCVVELGAWIGGTTVCLAAASRLRGGGLVYAVDTFEGSDGGCQPRLSEYGGSTWDAFQGNLQRAGVESHVRALRATTAEAGRAWNSQERGGIGLLFIDADHSYEAVREDTEVWLTHVVSGGIVAWHDYSEPHPGVIRAVDEMVSRGSVVQSDHVDGLFWATKP